MSQTPRACNVEKEGIDIRKALTKVIPLHGILLRQQAGVDPDDINAPQFQVWADMIDVETFQRYMKGVDALEKENVELRKGTRFLEASLDELGKEI